jgi:hypothetical protein
MLDLTFCIYSIKGSFAKPSSYLSAAIGVTSTLLVGVARLLLENRLSWMVLFYSLAVTKFPLAVLWEEGAFERAASITNAASTRRRVGWA